LEQLIGSGGMGDVYRAPRVDGVVDQTVAVKVLYAHSAHSPREAAILRDLRHTHIAQCLDDGVIDGHPYLAMEYVDGMPITEYADQRGMSIRGRLALFLNVCQAIAYVHHQTYLHMDLKPGNLLVNAKGEVKVIDFGIARRKDHGQSSGWSGVFSQPYASPEQIQGESRPGPATDIYSLGAVLYELLCGHPPFNPEIPPDRLSWHILEDIPEKPSDRVLETRLVTLPSGARWEMEPERIARMRGGGAVDALRKQLRGDLDTVCLFALRKTPGRRYRSVDDLMSDMESIIDGGHPRIARSGDPMYSAVAAARRRPLLPYAALLAAAATLGGAMYPRLFREAEIESRRREGQINQAADRTLDALRLNVRPRLTANPRYRAPVGLLDATLQAATPAAPAPLPWEDIPRAWKNLIHVLSMEQTGKRGGSQ
jgi:serine/threonine protein kinase